MVGKSHPVKFCDVVEVMVDPAKFGLEKYALFIHLHQFHFLSQNLDFTYLSGGSQVEHRNKERKFYNSCSLKLDGPEL